MRCEAPSSTSLVNQSVLRLLHSSIQAAYKQQQGCRAAVCRTQAGTEHKTCRREKRHSSPRFPFALQIFSHWCYDSACLQLNTQTQKYPAHWKAQRESDISRWLPLKNPVVVWADVSAQIATGGTCWPDVITSCYTQKRRANCAQTLGELETSMLFSIIEENNIIYWPLPT